MVHGQRFYLLRSCYEINEENAAVPGYGEAF